ncbi:hypothetical protein [Bradyrhizobium sp. 76]|uniref:hypothetical protein n=1 Tax=Bradyrhizobium sp. 76 TaxID=2782680 RepID=UPI001FF7344D|nr:hypothetical protein [Bradyrhizobium sp. 76]MCK1406851.1 hypothetical protein [Bradyrhizobium sp. 76]
MCWPALSQSPSRNTTSQRARALTDAIGIPAVIQAVGCRNCSAESPVQHRCVDGASAGQSRKAILVKEYLTGPLLFAEIDVRHAKFDRFEVLNDSRAMNASMRANSTLDQIGACFQYAAVGRKLGVDLGIFHADMIATVQGPVLVGMNSRPLDSVMPRCIAKSSA